MSAWYFVSVLHGRLGKTIDAISPRSMDALCAYDWPGNVRELQNVVERAMILSRGGKLDLSGVLPVKRVRASGAATKQEGQTIRLEDAERAHIESVLEQCGWKVGGKDGAAEKLGLKRSTLQSRMKKLGIQRPGGRGR